MHYEIDHFCGLNIMIDLVHAYLGAITCLKVVPLVSGYLLKFFDSVESLICVEEDES